MKLILEENEKWVRDFIDKYSVNKDGSVYSWKNGKRKWELKPIIQKTGYATVSLVVGIDGKKHPKTYLIQTLVKNAFMDGKNLSKDNKIIHINGDLSNNGVRNLKWIKNKDAYENFRDASGKHKRGVTIKDLRSGVISRYESTTIAAAAIKAPPAEIPIHSKNGKPYRGIYKVMQDA